MHLHAIFYYVGLLLSVAGGLIFILSLGNAPDWQIPPVPFRYGLALFIAGCVLQILGGIYGLVPRLPK